MGFVRRFFSDCIKVIWFSASTDPGIMAFCAAEGGVGGLSWKTKQKKERELENIITLFQINVVERVLQNLQRIIRTNKMEVSPAT